MANKLYTVIHNKANLSVYFEQHSVVARIDLYGKQDRDQSMLGCTYLQLRLLS